MTTPRRRIHLVPVLWLALFLWLAIPAPAQQVKAGGALGKEQAAAAAPTAAALTGSWEGYWLSPEGFFYSAEMHLEAAADNTVRGYINWTLEGSPRKSEQKKTGLTGVEYVRGEFEPTFGILTLEGYDKDDPNGILGLDRYRLFLAENARVIGGITWHHGDWTGQFMVEAR
jgi:hypothetical protein